MNSSTFANTTDLSLSSLQSDAPPVMSVRFAARWATGETSSGEETASRAAVEEDTREMARQLGAVWVRAQGAQKFGKRKLSELTDTQLQAVHGAATTATRLALRERLMAAKSYDEFEAIRVERGYKAGWTQAIMAHWQPVEAD